MRYNDDKNKSLRKPGVKRSEGFTLVEVIIAGSLMIILCVGMLSVFSYVVKINRGENLRMQALSVLQQRVEFYRSKKFSPAGTAPELVGRQDTPAGTETSADGRVFNISVSVDDDPSTPNTPDVQINPATKFKEIKITAVPAIAETGYLSNLRTTVTIQRVRTN